MIQDPGKNPDRHQNLIDSSPSHAPPLRKISSKSAIFCSQELITVTYNHTHAPDYLIIRAPAGVAADNKRILIE